MPITVRHDVADLPMPKVDPQKYNTGMGMAQQERKYAMDAEMLNQRQDYAMDAMQMRNAQENQGPPSLGQQGMMIDQAIRAGSFDPDTVKALRENVRKTNEAFRSRNINNEQRQQTMRNLQEERDLLWGMGYPSRKVESVAGKGNKEPMTGRQYYQNNPKEFNERVEQQRKIRIDAGQTNFTNTDLYNDVINDWEARQKFFNESPGSQPQGQPPAMGAQPTPASATAPPPAMGASPLSAPATAPLTYAPQSMESGRWGGQAFGTDPILAMPASPPIPGVATGALLPATPMSQRSSQPQPMPAQQQPMYPMEAIASSRVDPGYMAPQDSGFASARTFTSADGRSMVGSILGINPPSSNGGFSTVQIQRESDGKVFDVPLNNLSQQDQQYALSGGNRNTMYDMQNPQRSAGTDFMDPNNPVRQEMSAADQSIVNPQKRTLGSEYKGRYGLGGADYGINPATGNRVTASVRPGGTALEYDEPVGAPGTAMGGRKGSLNYLGGKRKVDQKKKAPVVGVDVSPNASPATELDAASAIESAKAVIADPNATTQDKYDAARSLVRSGVPEEEVVRLENAAKPTTTVKPATPTTTPVQPATPQQNANAVKRKRPMLSASTPLDKDGKPVQDPISSGAQWIYDQGSDAAIAARRWYYGFPDENNASPAPKPASTKPSVASQESRDWQNWWSTNRPDFESSGGEPSTWTSAKDSKKQLTGSVLRISEFTEGTRYVSIKDEKGRVFTLDIKRLSGADQKKLKDMYKAKKNESAGVKK